MNGTSWNISYECGRPPIDMKWYGLLSPLVGSMVSCHQVQQPEQPAIIIELTMPDPTVLCACCAGYKIQVDSEYYYTNTLPAAIEKPNTPVWIRYQADTDR